MKSQRISYFFSLHYSILDRHFNIASRKSFDILPLSQDVKPYQTENLQKDKSSDVLITNETKISKGLIIPCFLILMTSCENHIFSGERKTSQQNTRAREAQRTQLAHTRVSRVLRVSRHPCMTPALFFFVEIIDYSQSTLPLIWRSVAVKISR